MFAAGATLAGATACGSSVASTDAGTDRAAITDASAGDGSGGAPSGGSGGRDGVPGSGGAAGGTGGGPGSGGFPGSAVPLYGAPALDAGNGDRAPASDASMPPGADAAQDRSVIPLYGLAPPYGLPPNPVR
jgi:hypothetical protein